MEWALVNGLRSKAEKSGAVGICLGCGGEVRAKCGEVLVWHWAHINADCDPWTEPETEWHRWWKGFFPADWQEVIKPPHRADVAGPDGVLEIQRSGISPAEIREREQFYGRMAWLLNGHDFWEQLEILKFDGIDFRARWKRARKTWLTATKQVFIDTPWGLLKVYKITPPRREGGWTIIAGKIIDAALLMSVLDKTDPTGRISTKIVEYDTRRRAVIDSIIDWSFKLDAAHAQYESDIKCNQEMRRLIGRSEADRLVGEELALKFHKNSDVEICWKLESSEDWRNSNTRPWDGRWHCFANWIKNCSETYLIKQYDNVNSQIELEQWAKRIYKKELARIEDTRRKAQQDREALSRAIESQAAAVVFGEPFHSTSEGRRLPGKQDWVKILADAGIPEPGWANQP